MSGLPDHDGSQAENLRGFGGSTRGSIALPLVIAAAAMATPPLHLPAPMSSERRRATIPRTERAARRAKAHAAKRSRRMNR